MSIKNNRELLYYVTNIINIDSFDVQSFKIKKSKNYNKISCIVYTNPNSFDSMDETTGVKLKLKYYRNGNAFPSILTFGKYKTTLDEYESKRLYQVLLNRKYSNLFDNTTDKYADKLIEDAIRVETNIKSKSMNKISAVIEAMPADVGFDEQTDEDLGAVDEGEAAVYDDETPQMSIG